MDHLADNIITILVFTLHTRCNSKRRRRQRWEKALRIFSSVSSSVSSELLVQFSETILMILFSCSSRNVVELYFSFISISWQEKVYEFLPDSMIQSIHPNFIADQQCEMHLFSQSASLSDGVLTTLLTTINFWYEERKVYRQLFRSTYNPSCSARTEYKPR